MLGTASPPEICGVGLTCHESTTMINPDRLLEFIRETDKLKSVYRRAYLSDLSRNENSAEHSWHLCIALQVLEPQMPKDINLNHAIRIALNHDICEIGAGDVSVYSNERSIKHQQESSYMNDFQNRFGAAGTQMNEYWKEYEAQDTPESNWVKVVDRLLPFIMNLITEGKTWIEQGINKDQVLKVNQPIAQHHLDLFQWMENQIEIAVSRGWLKPAQQVDAPEPATMVSPASQHHIGRPGDL